MLSGIDPSYLSAGASALTIALALVAYVGIRRRSLRTSVQRETALLAQIDLRLDALSNQTTQHTQVAMERIHSDIQSLQSDMDWLAGERMIEQAIEMARTGRTANDICTELGMPLEAANTITTYRRH